ncbi:MAG: hypothetical protein AUG51_08125 [Acidobacteria bacterium 13_1_20CM_3_53_8]|nr:MAG: hypothetical protein AUG51_08125 [Acidobacteria bacterium 13_1_20CM_3_53_8]
MRVTDLSKLLLALLLLSLFSAPGLANEAIPVDDAARLLPDNIGDFRAHMAASPYKAALEANMQQDFGVLSAATREYLSTRGEKFWVTLVKTRSDSNAYSLLTNLAMLARRGPDATPAQLLKPGDVGTSGFLSSSGIAFVKGQTFVGINKISGPPGNTETMLTFARLFADTLDKGEGDIPVLVKHLPNWEQAQEQAIYSVTPHALQDAAGNRPVLDAVSFEGGTEAVTAMYGPSRMVLVEYSTPQIATDSDARIQTKIKELRDAGQPVPSGYRRVGNYSVFVFDAPDEQTAEQLINGVTYEQVVQWLGENPRLLERAQRYYTQMTGGVILAVLKASGLSVLLCFGIGGLFGWLVFKRRRARAAATESYSDAGGIVRLNLDEMTPQTDSSRLLGKGDV